MNSKDVVPLVIQIFSDQVYIAYQKTYLTILVNYILPIRQHQTNISCDHWKELFKLSIELYEKAQLAHIDKNVILEAVYKLIKHGCRQSHLALHLRNILPFLGMILYRLLDWILPFLKLHTSHVWPSLIVTNFVFVHYYLSTSIIWNLILWIR